MQALKRVTALMEHYRLGTLKYVGVFFIILFGFHIIYSLLVDKETLMIPGLEGLYIYLRKLLYAHSAWVVEHIVGYEIVRKGFAIELTSGRSILVDESCSAVKWFAHFLVLMLLFPGPRKHKLWFIPAGIIITHLVNIIRIVGLTIVFANKPEAFTFYHDYVFRPFFYLVLFLMWVLWVERFFLPQKNKT